MVINNNMNISFSSNNNSQFYLRNDAPTISKSGDSASINRPISKTKKVIKDVFTIIGLVGMVGGLATLGITSIIDKKQINKNLKILASKLNEEDYIQAKNLLKAFNTADKKEILTKFITKSGEDGHSLSDFARIARDSYTARIRAQNSDKHCEAKNGLSTILSEYIA